MLRQRVLTALVAAPLVLAAIFLAPLVWFGTFFLVLAAIGAYEWFRLAALPRKGSFIAWSVFLLALLAFAGSASAGVERVLLAVACATWFVAGTVVMAYPRSTPLLTHPLMNASLCIVLLSAAWYALLALRASTGGGWLVMWMFATVWAADIGAYFAGRAFGRHKLAPAVSPGKTWEGVYGGLIAAVSVGALLGAVVPVLAARFTWIAWGTVALPIAVVSIYGDLFESTLKRVAGVKDSGTLFPGHGGALDRIDSLIAVAPFFALWILLSRPVLP